MNYLLSGEAETTVKGLQLKNENYSVPMDLLKTRFGDKQFLVSSHMSKLLSLNTIKSVNDTVGMRAVYDELQAQVRNLKSLGLDANNYGPMLVPVLMSKLPEEMKLIISREFSNQEIWDISKILDKFKSKIQAREKVCFVGGEREDRVNSFEPYSGSSFNIHGQNNSFNRYNPGKQNRLHDGNNKQTKMNKNNLRTMDYSYRRNENNRSFARQQQSYDKCIFCGNQHNSKFCGNVTRPGSRKEILLKERLVFVVLKRIMCQQIVLVNYFVQAVMGSIIDRCVRFGKMLVIHITIVTMLWVLRRSIIMLDR